MNWYGYLKVIHVLSAIVWIGGGVALTAMLNRLLRANDRATLKVMVPQTATFMQKVGGPASGVLLITGIAMVLVSHMGFKSLWISVAFGGIVLIGAFGGLVMGKRMEALERVVASGSDDALAVAGASVKQAAAILITMMAIVVGIMVLKPTL